MTKTRWHIRPYLRGLVIDALGISKPPKNPPPPQGPSIVVLPFESVSGDEEQEYLTDGVTNELTTALARANRYVFVISSDTAFSYKGKSPDPAALGTELGVRYIVRGTVARKDDQVHINAELTEASTGKSLCSEAFQAELTDLRAVRKKIVERLLSAVGFELESAELEQYTNPPASIHSVEAVWRGYYHMRQLTHRDLLAARALFQSAIDDDPKCASAYGLLAGTFTQEHTQGWNLSDTHLEHARGLAAKGASIDPNAGVCHAILGVVELAHGNWRQAIKHEDRAIALDPCVTWPHAMRGIALTQGHQRLEASRSIRRALRLDPHPPHGLLMALAYINYGAGRKDEAIELLETVRRENADNILARVGLATFHQREGDQAYAREVGKEIMKINPDMRVEIAMELIPALKEIHPRAEFVRYADDLAAAGVPRLEQKVGSAR